MQVQITGHYKGSSPIATIAFEFEKADPRTLIGLMPDLAAKEGGEEVFSEMRMPDLLEESTGGQPEDMFKAPDSLRKKLAEARMTHIIRTSVKYHASGSSLIVLLTYRLVVLDPSHAEKHVQEDVEGIKSVFEAVLAPFDK